MQAFRGTLIHAPGEPGLIEILLDRAVLVASQHGRIVHMAPGEQLQLLCSQHDIPPERVTVLSALQFFTPGFIDCHIHAPQYEFAGTGTDLPLFEWLHAYTFPTEASFQDLDHARAVYERLVQRCVRSGTTCANYFTTLHAEPCRALMDIVERAGQRAFIGKVSMDQNSPDNYRESTSDGLASAGAVLQEVSAARHRTDGRITPVVIPRFLPTCSSALLVGLSKLAAQHGALVHSHISESIAEVACSSEVHPGQPHEAATYHAAGLLDQSIMAHGTQLSDVELAFMAEHGAAIAHCPLSNLYFGDGLLNVMRALQLGVKVGLGSDVAGGYTHCMLQAQRMAVINGLALRAGRLMHARQQADPLGKSAGGDGVTGAGGQAATLNHAASTSAASAPVLTYKHAFWLATAGGAAALGIADKVGWFEEGLEFDALMVDAGNGHGFDVFPGRDQPEMLFEKFLHLGVEGNIMAVYVQGKKIS